MVRTSGVVRTTWLVYTTFFWLKPENLALGNQSEVVCEPDHAAGSDHFFLVQTTFTGSNHENLRPSLIFPGC